MNKNAIQKFAVWARVQLIGAVKQRAFSYEITGGGDKPELDAAGGRLLTNAEKSQRRELIGEIRRKGFDQVMEEAAYTWFNRFIALRFMEVNNYLPSKVRLFTDENGAFKPQILKEAMTVELDGLDRGVVLGLLDKQENEALYKYLLITQCNALNAALPGMFEKIANWTELLFPDNLLRADNVLGRMISDIPEEDWKDAVQIIGWLYQYYNTELKDDTFAQLKKNIKITKERIPAATQLFTPDWIVRYMVENSLGRLWLEGHPNAELRDGWKYYLDEAEQEPEVEAQLAKLREEYKTIQPEDIKIIDPCMGSGHILVYAFDVLMQIYEAQGYSQRDAAKLIVEKNLYGIDIDKRAYQLAYFSVMMKARQYNRRILNGEIAPNLIYIQDSNSVCREHLQYFGWAMSKIESNNARTQLEYLLDTFKDATEYGSILHVDPLDWGLLYEYTGSVEYPDQVSLDELDVEETKDALRALVVQGAILAQKYDVVVTNPPYMGNGGMNDTLNRFVKSRYPNSKSDLSTVFMEKCMFMCNSHGMCAMINIPVWMFISTYGDFRKRVLHHTIVNMVHLGRGIFGSDFGTTAFVFQVSRIKQYASTYLRLFDKPSSINSVEEKETFFLEKKGRFITVQDNFVRIPGSPIAYWVSNHFIKCFQSKCLGDYVELVEGIHTRDNDRFLRLWHEIDFLNSALGARNSNDLNMNMKWYAYNKGGLYRQWYGNNEFVVNWENNGAAIKGFKKASVGKCNHFFDRGITFTFLTSSVNSFRFSPYGNLYDFAGPTMYTSDEYIYSLLGLLTSKVCYHFLKVINPTMNMPLGDMKKFPVIEDKAKKTEISDFSFRNVSLSKTDWDSYETSWDFKRNPLV